MRKFGLVGYPLAHSFSKQYFTEKFKNEGISDCLYENFPLTSLDSLQDLLSSDSLIEGLNVTIPYKSEVLKHLDVIDSEAYEVGAVNVLKVRRSGNKIELFGFNSDITGISDTLKPFVSSLLTDALILGTGGSSKAICHVLRNMGIRYTLVSRTRKAGCLTYGDISPEMYNDIQLIINTTPLGMFPNIETMPAIRYDLLGRQHILFDLVYNPQVTAFLKMGQSRGSTVINGLKMLYSQAEKSWNIWNSDDY